MTASAIPEVGAALDLPPPFRLVSDASSLDAFAEACALASLEGAGALVRSGKRHHLDFAIVLQPEEPLRSARRAFLACMAALADAVGSVAPPQKPVTIDWPDALRFDGARLGGGRLGWPEGCGEDEVPDWLVFSATLIVSKRHAGDPGLTPESTSFEEEGFDDDSSDALVGVFARYLLRAFDSWRENGFEAAAQAYLERLDREARASIVAGGGAIADLPLGPALRTPSWLDPHSGAPRL